MHVEVSVAVNFVISYMYNKLPRRMVTLFSIDLENGIKKKFEGHWYPDRPFKGSGFRCVPVNGEKVDPVVEDAAVASGLVLDEIKVCLPSDLTLWIDPLEVSYRIGEKGPVKVLYSDKKEDDYTERMDREIQVVNKGFNPEAQCFKPIESLSSSLNSLCFSPFPPPEWSHSTTPSVSPAAALFGSANNLSAHVPSPSQFITTSPLPLTKTPLNNKPQRPQQFTAASFAQTKFGSTKLKTAAKRPSRLSPTDFGKYIRQRSPTSGPPSLGSPETPRSLSPRDPRVEFYLDQRQRFVLAEHQQQQQQLQQHAQSHNLSPISQQYFININNRFGDPYSGLPQISPPGLPTTHHARGPELPITLTPPGLSSNQHQSLGVDLPIGSATSQSSMLPPESQKSFIDNLNLTTLGCGNGYQRLLIAN